MTDLVAVSGEPLWPRSHGGRIRFAGIVGEMARHFTVTVVAPLEAGVSVPGSVEFEPLPDEPPVSRLVAAAGPGPRFGRALLGPRRGAALGRLVARCRPRAVLFAHGYLAAAAPALGVDSMVDFADVEVRRMASLAAHGEWRSRAAYRWESVKAHRWERTVARRAAVASTPSALDADLLASWGANAVLVPNGADRFGWCASPAEGPVTFVANFAYRPNRDAGAYLLREVWPQLRESDPGLRLRLVGRGAARAIGWTGLRDGVEVVSDPATTDGAYREAAVIVAPVVAGGGAQLKVTEALARNRVVVATAFSVAAAPPGTGDAVVAADSPDAFAVRVAELWRDRPGRWARERALAERRPVPTWAEACAPLVDALNLCSGCA